MCNEIAWPLRDYCTSTIHVYMCTSCNQIKSQLNLMTVFLDQVYFEYMCKSDRIFNAKSLRKINVYNAGLFLQRVCT